MALEEMQHSFLSAMAGDRPTSLSLKPGAISFEAQLDIYRNNYIHALTRALALTYPVVQQLVGEDFFSAMIRAYIKARPPETDNLDYVGTDLADFISNFPPAASLPYLADVATLEWAYHVSGLVPVSSALTLESLQNLGAEAYANLRVRLNSSCHLYASPWPVNHIWAMHQKGAKVEEIDLQSGNIALLVINRSIITLSQGEFAFLCALNGKSNFADAYEAAILADPEFNLEFCVTRHMVGGVFESFI